MCLITVCPKGTSKYSDMLVEALKTAATTNTDGMGFMYKKHTTKKVFLSKGYKTIEGLIKSLKSHRLKDNDELVIHQRIGNKGAKNEDMCHPFIVTDIDEQIVKNHTYSDFPTMVHNGTFHSYSKNNSDFSDTFFFIRDFIYRPELLLLLKNDLDFFKKIFTNTLQQNRLCFLFPNEDTELIKIGEYKEDEGYFFSNESYKNKHIRNVGGVSYPSEDFHSRRFMGGWYDQEDYDEYDDESDYAVSSGWNQPNVVPGKQLALPTTTEFNGYKEANIKLGDIVVNSGVTVECERSHVKFRLYMDMWIPERYVTMNQFRAVRFNPTEFNFTDFRFLSIAADDDMGLEKDTYYKMIHYDDSSKKGGSEGLHILTRCYSIGSKASDPIYVPGYRLPSLFEITPITEKLDKYMGYYMLCSQLNISKTMLKKVDKLMSINNYKSKPTLSFRGIENIPPAAMSLFHLLLIKNLYVKTYINEVNKKNMVIIN